MTETQNYNLCQWAAEDRIMRTDFNDAMASIDTAIKAANDAMPRIATGTYTGTGEGGASITFPFRPLFLAIVGGKQQGINVVAANSGNWDAYMAAASSTSNPVGLRGSYSFTGNTIAINNNVQGYAMNAANTTYHWVAIG